MTEHCPSLPFERPLCKDFELYWFLLVHRDIKCEILARTNLNLNTKKKKYQFPFDNHPFSIVFSLFRQNISWTPSAVKDIGKMTVID